MAEKKTLHHRVWQRDVGCNSPYDIFRDMYITVNPRMFANDKWTSTTVTCDHDKQEWIVKSGTLKCMSLTKQVSPAAAAATTATAAAAAAWYENTLLIVFIVLAILCLVLIIVGIIICLVCRKNEEPSEVFTITTPVAATEETGAGVKVITNNHPTKALMYRMDYSYLKKTASSASVEKTPPTVWENDVIVGFIPPNCTKEIHIARQDSQPGDKVAAVFAYAPKSVKDESQIVEAFKNPKLKVINRVEMKVPKQADDPPPLVQNPKPKINRVDMAGPKTADEPTVVQAAEHTALLAESPSGSSSALEKTQEPDSNEEYHTPAKSQKRRNKYHRSC